MNTFKLTFLFLLTMTACFGQEINYQEIEPPFLMTKGHATRYLEPDRIFVNIKIDEELIRKSKDDIDIIESNMISGLNSIGVEKDKIRLVQADMIYMNLNWFNSKRINEREYKIEVQNAEQLNSVYEVLNELQVNQARVSHYQYSKADSVMMVLRTEAAQQAKRKAEVLVQTIDEELGELLLLTETDNDHIHIRGARTNQSNYYLDGVRVYAPVETAKDDQLENISHMNTIKLESTIYLKYRIK